MAASMQTVFVIQLLANILIFSGILPSGHAKTHFYHFKPNDILAATKSSCLFLIDKSAEMAEDSKLLDLLDSMEVTYKDEENIHVGITDVENFTWPSGKELLWKITDIPEKYKNKNIIFFSQHKPDRTCLYRPHHLHNEPMAEYFGGPINIDTVTQFVNNRCHAFRKPGGSLSPEGMHRKYILENVFRMKEVSKMKMGNIFSTYNNPLNQSVVFNKRHDFELDSDDAGVCDNEMCAKESNQNFFQKTSITECEKIKMPISKEDFFNDYLKKSKPVILEGAVKHWDAFTKWTNEFLRKEFGPKDVHVKLTPGGDFEGVEPVNIWENYQNFYIPDEVRRALKYPDLVVVRPAGISMKFSEFLDLIEWASNQPERNVSAYLEYTSIKEYFSSLEGDLEEFEFVKDLLLLKHLNIWLSDGNTIGKLHFDAYDNFLSQLSGTKEVILFEPFQNDLLYEGHIAQATLSYNKTGHRFRRYKLEESTSMVMSPVDMRNPNFERFPEFAYATPLNCTIAEGDVLYMPSFWWHEVKSLPNSVEKRNLAINYWYEPFLTRDFPCPECEMDVNPAYTHLL